MDMKFTEEVRGGRKLISTGSTFEKKASYSRALVDGDWCFVAGTTGYDYQEMSLAKGGAGPQTRQTFQNIKASLEAAGFSVEDIVRVNVIIVRREDIEAVMTVLGEVFADVRAPNTAIIADLVDPAMLVEIEVTALRRT